jgi:putative transposase
MDLSYELKHEFVTPCCLQENGLEERMNRTLNVQCVHGHRFETQHHAMRIIPDCIQFYNHRRLQHTLGMKTRAQSYPLAA